MLRRGHQGLRDDAEGEEEWRIVWLLFTIAYHVMIREMLIFLSISLLWIERTRPLVEGWKHIPR